MMTLKKAPLSFDEFDELPALEFEDEINNLNIITKAELMSSDLPSCTIAKKS
jgi:hypothetical protein